MLSDNSFFTSRGPAKSITKALGFLLGVASVQAQSSTGTNASGQNSASAWYIGVPAALVLLVCGACCVCRRRTLLGDWMRKRADDQLVHDYQQLGHERR